MDEDTPLPEGVAWFAPWSWKREDRNLLIVWIAVGLIVQWTLFGVAGGFHQMWWFV